VLRRRWRATVDEVGQYCFGRLGGGLPSRPILNGGADRPASPGSATSIPSRVSRSTRTFASQRTSGTPAPRSVGRRREFEADAAGAVAVPTANHILQYW
jgi:hypothetical protein